MTNKYITDFLLENGAPLYSFRIIDTMKYIDGDGKEQYLDTYPLGDDISISNFIKVLKDSKGVCVIYNGEWNNCEFGVYGTWLRAKFDTTDVYKRMRKLGKLQYEIFRKRITDSI